MGHILFMIEGNFISFVGSGFLYIPIAVLSHSVIVYLYTYFVILNTLLHLLSFATYLLFLMVLRPDVLSRNEIEQSFSRTLSDYITLFIYTM